MQTYPTTKYNSFEEVIELFLAESHSAGPRPSAAALAVAGMCLTLVKSVTFQFVALAAHVALPELQLKAPSNILDKRPLLTLPALLPLLLLLRSLFLFLFLSYVWVRVEVS